MLGVIVAEELSQYSDAQLYNQLRYYMSLFDVVKAYDIASGKLKRGTCSPRCAFDSSMIAHTATLDLHALMLVQGQTCTHLQSVVEKYLDQSGRRWVQMSTLFSFMKM